MMHTQARSTDHVVQHEAARLRSAALNYCTASRTNSAVEALRRGATDYLLKPLKPQTVIDRTQSILADKQKERRRRELQRQIDTLQAEVMALDKNASTSSDTSAKQTNSTDDRFLKRGMLTLDMHTRRVTMNERIINLPPPPSII